MAIGQIYQTALSRWLADQSASRNKFAEAESPLVQLQGEFAPGGTYEKGQFDIINQEGIKAGAKGMADLVATGMSSGSQAVGLGSRIAKDMAIAKTGVEATRVSNLSNVLRDLSGLRGAAATQLGNASDPFASTYMGLTSQESEGAANRALEKQKIAAAERAQRSAQSAAQAAAYTENFNKTWAARTPSSGGSSSESFALPNFEW